MTQLGIDWTPRQASVEALERLPISRVREDHRRILDALANGPMTDAELQAVTGIHPNAIRARRGELHEAGHILIAGKKPNKHGRNITLWRLAGAGR